MVFDWSLSGRKSPQVPKTLVSILANLNNAVILIFPYSPVHTVYWPTIRPGCRNRKYTCVNNRCIRSKNIPIITLTVDRLNECEIVTPTRRRWTLNYYISQCTGNLISLEIEQLGVRRVGDKMLDWGACPREAGPPVEQSRRTRKKRGNDQ